MFCTPGIFITVHMGMILSPVFLSQFADGVILLLLIGQLEGFFIPLADFNLTPINESEMVEYIWFICGFQFCIIVIHFQHLNVKCLFLKQIYFWCYVIKFLKFFYLVPKTFTLTYLTSNLTTQKLAQVFIQLPS